MAACPTIGQCNKYKYMHTRKDLTAMIYVSFMSTNLASQQYDRFSRKSGNGSKSTTKTRLEAKCSQATENLLPPNI